MQMVKIRKLVWATVLLSAVFLFGDNMMGYAQESTEVYKLGQVVVTASKMEEELEKVPARVEVITREKMIRGCLDNICDKIGSNKDFMCLIYIGRAVVGKPFTTFQEGLSIYLRRNEFFDE